MSSSTQFNDEIHEWIVELDHAGERVDKYVTDCFSDPAISRTQVQDWVKNGHVQIDGKPVKTNYKVQEGNQVVVQMPELEALEIVAEAIELDVVYEDSDVIVINKQRGMVVHPAPGHSTGTVVNALMHHCKDLSGINGMLRPGIVHRIDKDTTGL